MTVSVRSSTASNVLVDLEIYDSSGAKVFQQFWDNQTFSAGQTRTYSATHSVPLTARTGTYTVSIGIFGPGWSSFIAWNGQAAVFAVN